MTKRRRSGASRRQAESRFWGQETAPAEETPSSDGSSAESPSPPAPRPPVQIRPTPDPGALVRSLGPPPLAVDQATSERHLTAVYEEAVRAATALAAANGLLAGDDPGAT